MNDEGDFGGGNVGGGGHAGGEFTDEVSASIGARVESAIGRLFAGIGESVFNTERFDDRLIITAAAVQRAGGFGFGGGSGDSGGELGGGGGGGGGGQAEGRPVAVIEVSQYGVSVQPVIDFTKVGVTLLAGLFAVWRIGRRRS
jgi:hypothetical protein